MTRIIHTTKPVQECSPEERSALFQLLQEGFLGVGREIFDQDFIEKDSVILLRRETPDGVIVGFSTLMTLPFPSQNALAVFSGDTTVLPQYRKSSGLGIELGRYFMMVLERNPGRAVYYVLISKGWRTYKVLPFLFREYYPHPARPTPAREREIIAAFGRTRYPGQYDPCQGIIMAGADAPRLKPGSVDAPLPQGDIHAQYFIERNPGYMAGNELICMAKVAPENFTPNMDRLLTRTE